MKVKRLAMSLALATGLVLLTALVLGLGSDATRAQGPLEPPGRATGDVEAAGADEWTSLGGPTARGGRVTALATSANVSGTVYAVVDHFGLGRSFNAWQPRLYTTTNGGASWMQVYTAPQGSPSIDTLVFTGTRVVYGVRGCIDTNYCGPSVTPDGGASIYRSTDGGVTFTPVYTTPMGAWHRVKSLAQNPITPTILFAAGTERSPTTGWHLSVIRSTDDGFHWTQVYTEPANGYLNVVAVSPHTPTLALVGGQNWGTGDNPLYRSIDGGDSWTQVYTTTSDYFTDVDFDTANPSRVYAATVGNNFHVSTDGGATWSQVVGNGSAGSIFAVGSLIAANWSEILTSADGITWAQVGRTPEKVNALEIGPQGVLWAGLDSGPGISRSDDGGVNWTHHEANDGIESFVVPTDIELDPFDPDVLYVAPGGYPSLFKSTDGGDSWDQLPTAYGLSFGAHPATSGTLLAGVSNCGSGTLIRTTDGGLIWTDVYTPPFIVPDCSAGYGDIIDVAFHPANPQVAYGVGIENPNDQTSEAVIMRSTDGGLNWTLLFTQTTEYVGRGVGGFTSLSFHPYTTSVVFAAGARGTWEGDDYEGVVYRTTNGGTSWTAVLTQTNEHIRTVAVAPWNPNYVYAATDGAWGAGQNTTLYRSTDGGLNWTTILTQANSNFVTPDPWVPNRLYLSSPYWVGVSIDAGDIFTDFLGTSGVLPEMETGGVMAIRSGGITQTLYLGSLGVWEYSHPQPGTRLFLPTIFKNH